VLGTAGLAIFSGVMGFSLLRVMVVYREVFSEARCEEVPHDVPLGAAVARQPRRSLTPANGVDARSFRLDPDSFETPKHTPVLPRVRGTASNRIPEEWGGSNRRHGTLTSTEEGSEGLRLVHHVGGKHLCGDGSEVPRVVDDARRVKERVAVLSVRVGLSSNRIATSPRTM
jgi:hypothetical protein